QETCRRLNDRMTASRMTPPASCPSYDEFSISFFDGMDGDHFIGLTWVGPSNPGFGSTITVPVTQAIKSRANPKYRNDLIPVISYTSEAPSTSTPTKPLRNRLGSVAGLKLSSVEYWDDFYILPPSVTGFSQESKAYEYVKSNNLRPFMALCDVPGQDRDGYVIMLDGKTRCLPHVETSNNFKTSRYSDGYVTLTRTSGKSIVGDPKGHGYAMANIIIEVGDERDLFLALNWGGI
ncbi:MAG: hypothetical protein AAFQ99_13160, partial [Pseudomonadota bacterium]